MLGVGLEEWEDLRSGPINLLRLCDDGHTLCRNFWSSQWHCPGVRTYGCRPSEVGKIARRSWTSLMNPQPFNSWERKNQFVLRTLIVME